jgi:hypothetical protein
MKIKTVVFWILWVGNDFILQTIDPGPALSVEQPRKLDAVENVADGTRGSLGTVRTGINFAF